MIVNAILISSASEEEFGHKLVDAIIELEKIDLTEIEIQYKPVVDRDEYTYIVYTALLIGRRKRNE